MRHIYQKNCGMLRGPNPVVYWAWLTSESSLPRMCYGTEFGRSTPNRMGVGMSPKYLGTL